MCFTLTPGVVMFYELQMSLATSHQFQFTSADGLPIACTRWHNRNPPRGVIQIAHGMGSFAAQQYVLDHSDLIDGLILSGSGTLDGLARLVKLMPLERAICPGTHTVRLVEPRSDSCRCVYERPVVLRSTSARFDGI